MSDKSRFRLPKSVPREKVVDDDQVGDGGKRQNERIRDRRKIARRNAYRTRLQAQPYRAANDCREKLDESTENLDHLFVVITTVRLITE